MKNPILAILVLGFLAGTASCSGQSGLGSGTGGTPAGGTPGSGGTTSSGGVTGSGGQPGTGGTSSTGGRSGSGGTTESGGQPGTGGASSTGGRVGSGGTSARGGNGNDAGSGSGGVAGSGGTTTAGQSGTSATGGGTGRDAGPDVPTGTGGVATGGRSGTGGAAGGSSASGGTGGGGTTGTGGSGAATPSAGCGKTPTLTSGSHTITSSGSSRSYMMRIPPNYDNSHPYPLVFAFHWNGGTMNDIDGGGSSGYTWSYYGLREQADNSTNSKMIFVAPQGNGNGWANSGGQDLTLVDDLVKLLEGDLCVDTTRIFSMGFSYGGGMTYAIACARAKVFRAAAVYSGAQLSGCTGGTDPIAYIGIHGVSDGTCNISGGRSLRDKFVSNNGCTAQSPPEPSAGSGKHICTSYAGCSTGHPVRWCAFDGGHTPGNVDGGGDDGAKTWTKAEAWQFFTQF
jgi:poly(3-hydroxybutyrate) depolymerase